MQGARDAAYVDETTAESLATAAQLLGVDLDKLTGALQESVNITRGEVIRKKYDISAAYGTSG